MFTSDGVRALTEAMLADPHENTIRLVLADALDEADRGAEAEAWRRFNGCADSSPDLMDGFGSGDRRESVFALLLVGTVVRVARAARPPAPARRRKLAAMYAKGPGVVGVTQPPHKAFVNGSHLLYYRSNFIHHAARRRMVMSPAQSMHYRNLVCGLIDYAIYATDTSERDITAYVNHVWGNTDARSVRATDTGVRRWLDGWAYECVKVCRRLSAGKRKKSRRRG